MLITFESQVDVLFFWLLLKVIFRLFTPQSIRLFNFSLLHNFKLLTVLWKFLDGWYFLETLWRYCLRSFGPCNNRLLSSYNFYFFYWIYELVLVFLLLNLSSASFFNQIKDFSVFFKFIQLLLSLRRSDLVLLNHLVLRGSIYVRKTRTGLSNLMLYRIFYFGFKR